MHSLGSTCLSLWLHYLMNKLLIAKNMLITNHIVLHELQPVCRKIYNRNNSTIHPRKSFPCVVLTLYSLSSHDHSISQNLHFLLLATGESLWHWERIPTNTPTNCYEYIDPASQTVGYDIEQFVCLFSLFHCIDTIVQRGVPRVKKESQSQLTSTVTLKSFLTVQQTTINR